MRREGQVGRWQAGVPVLQATFLPGQALVLAAAGGDGAVHLLDLGSPLCKPSTLPCKFLSCRDDDNDNDEG